MVSEQQKSTMRMVKIKSCDGVVVEVPEAVAVQSVVIKYIVEDVGVEFPIPTPNVTGDILTKVLEFCTKHVEFAAEFAAAAAAAAAARKPGCDDQQAAEAAAAKEEMDRWDRQFINVHVNTFFDILTAADYLDIGELMNLCCDKMASMIADKSPEEIRSIFNIQNDFTPEEEEAVRRKKFWAFDNN